MGIAIMNKPYVFLEDQFTGRRRLYQNPCDIITARKADEVPAALAKLQAYHDQGFYLAGYCAYELGYAFEDILAPLMPENMTSPILQFGVFENYTDEDLPFGSSGHINTLQPDWDSKDYQARFDKVMAWIKAGDIYQVNLTFPVHGTYEGDAASLYAALKVAQPVRYGGIISLARNQGDADIVSLSPELFYELRGEKMSMRPMKGTAPRGQTDEQDRELADALQADAKNRAENLMIVDLLRNDLSRIAEASSVKVTDLFSLETYPSLHTMTSGIEGKVAGVSFENTLRALFPCGSITGAPKIRAQEIIRVLESTPRGVYCGALGLMDPDGYARFNVAIRTLSLRADGTYKYGVGSGVVADSNARDEYNECMLKASFLQSDYGLIETFGWHKQTGFMWLDLHLARLEKSALALEFMFSKQAIVQALSSAVDKLTGAQRVRLELSKDGTFDIKTTPLVFPQPDTVWRVALSKNPVSSSNTLLTHKTTRRDFIEGELGRLKTGTDCQEVLLFNERDELCEGSYTNVFIVKDGQMLTPPVTCGLLPGILRQVMLANGDVREQVLTLDDIRIADAIYVGNSLRGLIRTELTNPNRV